MTGAPFACASIPQGKGTDVNYRNSPTAILALPFFIPNAIPNSFTLGEAIVLRPADWFI